MIMAMKILDTLGQKCPQPILKLAVEAPRMERGEILEILGDCPTFESDVRKWCDRLGKVMLAVVVDGSSQKRIQIQF